MTGRFEQNDFFADTRQIIHDAEGNGTVINIHPLDMTELLNESSFDTVSIIPTAAVDAVGTKVSKQYVVIRDVVIGDKVYFQTIDVPRTGNKL